MFLSLDVCQVAKRQVGETEVAIQILINKVVFETIMKDEKGAKDAGRGDILFHSKGESGFERVENSGDGHHFIIRSGDCGHDAPEELLEAVAAQLGGQNFGGQGM